MKALWFFIVLALTLTGPAGAHETTRSYVDLTQDGAAVSVDFRIAFRDIEVVVWIDENLDGKITWGETRRRVDAIAAYVSSTFTLDAGGPCPLHRRSVGVSRNSGVDYIDLSFAAKCMDKTVPMRATSRLFAEIDPEHRVFLTASTGAASMTALLNSSNNSVELSDTSGTPVGFQSYFSEGMRHLLGGADHLVFLLILILPYLAAGSTTWHAAKGVAVAVTGFTVAHALTLMAATTNLLRPPTSLIEILIAVSIVLTAADNLRPFMPAPRAVVAAVFGLIHGFGFATALGAANLSAASFASALIGFNFGIEVAQIGVVLSVLPALRMLGHSRLILNLGSSGALIVGLYWIWERL